MRTFLADNAARQWLLIEGSRDARSAGHCSLIFKREATGWRCLLVTAS